MREKWRAVDPTDEISIGARFIQFGKFGETRLGFGLDDFYCTVHDGLQVVNGDSDKT